MTNRTRSLLTVLLVGSGVILLDRLSKLWILNNLELYESQAPIPALAPYLLFFHTNNTGVAFGLFQSGGMLFAVVSAIACVGILFYSYRQGHESILINISLGLMLGGAAGNLWDRLIYSGKVLDFILVQIPDVFQFATFNVADSSIVVGTSLLVVLLFLEDRQNAVEEKALADQIQ